MRIYMPHAWRSNMCMSPSESQSICLCTESISHGLGIRGWCILTGRPPSSPGGATGSAPLCVDEAASDVEPGFAIALVGCASIPLQGKGGACWLAPHVQRLQPKTALAATRLLF